LLAQYIDEAIALKKGLGSNDPNAPPVIPSTAAALGMGAPPIDPATGMPPPPQGMPPMGPEMGNQIDTSIPPLAGDPGVPLPPPVM
jgi:hypothetical protein